MVLGPRESVPGGAGGLGRGAAGVCAGLGAGAGAALRPPHRGGHRPLPDQPRRHGGQAARALLGGPRARPGEPCVHCPGCGGYHCVRCLEPVGRVLCAAGGGAGAGAALVPRPAPGDHLPPPPRAGRAPRGLRPPLRPPLLGQCGG